MVQITYSAILQGMEVYPIQVEVDMADGLPGIELVGSLGKEVREAAERVRVALKNSGYLMPPKRFTINLSPADIRKSGTSFDIPIAVGILCCMGVLHGDDLDEVMGDIMMIGELGLDGAVKSINGVLPLVIEARDLGYQQVILPADNLGEGRLIEGIDMVPVDKIDDVIYYMKQLERVKRTGEIEDTEGTEKIEQ